MLKAEGESRFKIALEMMTHNLDVLVKQMGDLPPSESSVSNVLTEMRAIASIGHQALVAKEKT